MGGRSACSDPLGTGPQSSKGPGRGLRRPPAAHRRVSLRHGWVHSTTCLHPTKHSPPCPHTRGPNSTPKSTAGVQVQTQTRVGRKVTTASSLGHLSQRTSFQRFLRFQLFGPGRHCCAFSPVAFCHMTTFRVIKNPLNQHLKRLYTVPLQMSLSFALVDTQRV